MSEEAKDEPSGKAIVGYRQPPIAHRFQKGRSGNPRGRPRKIKPANERPVDPVQAYKMADLVMTEAIRPIQIRENDEIVELPLIQAVIRSLGVAAVKGSHRAQVAITSMVKAVQDKDYNDRAAIYEAALKYKAGWQEVFDRCDARGEPRPEPVPHPDEVILDSSALAVRFNGPTTIDEKRKWDARLKKRQEWLEEAEDNRKRARGRSRFASQYADEAKHADHMARLMGAAYPDEATRRQPGFDIEDWRAEQVEWIKVWRANRTKIAP